MRSPEISQRYAKAMFDLSTSGKRVEEVLNEIREVNEAVEKSPELKSFFTGPTISREDQLKAIAGLFEKKKFSEDVKGLLTILIQKRRFNYLPDIAISFQTNVDDAKGIARGEVKSASSLFPDERAALEVTISRFIAKKVVLEYQQDDKLVGGLVARVGSYTFDDTIETQLRLMREAIKKRRAN